MRSSHSLGGTNQLAQNALSQLWLERAHFDEIDATAQQCFEMALQPCEVEQAHWRVRRELHQRRSHVAVEGDLVAYTQAHGDSTTVYVAHGPSGAASPVLTLLDTLDEIVISPDARMIAATVYGRDTTKQTAAELALVPIATPAKTRFIATGGGGYEAVWTRDSKAVFYLQSEKNWAQTSIWRYPVRADEPPQNVTKNETSKMWGYELSPDGRAVLVPAEHGRGSTLWRVDFKEAMRAYAEAKVKAQQAGKGKP